MLENLCRQEDMEEAQSHCILEPLRTAGGEETVPSHGLGIAGEETKLAAPPIAHGSEQGTVFAMRSMEPRESKSSHAFDTEGNPKVAHGLEMPRTSGKNCLIEGEAAELVCMQQQESEKSSLVEAEVDFHLSTVSRDVEKKTEPKQMVLAGTSEASSSHSPACQSRMGLAGTERATGMLCNASAPSGEPRHSDDRKR